MNDLKCTECGVQMTERDARVEVHKNHPLLRRLFCYDCYIKWTLAGRPERGRANPIHLCFIAILVILCFIPTCSQAQVTAGKVQAVKAPICMTKEAAVNLANIDAKFGPQAVMTVLGQSQECAVIVAEMKIKGTVFTVQTARGATSVVEVQVEMVDDTWKTLFILVDTPVIGELKA